MNAAEQFEMGPRNMHGPDEARSNDFLKYGVWDRARAMFVLTSDSYEQCLALVRKDILDKDQASTLETIIF